ncbi:MAG: Unknown protein [uncultured Sulfurovum sp.]|uniref:Uncharacterized protein n=1 Tax=uncultured Sulfurovum sp. TaxID=269237 RepID=A0A6S6SZU1_9BACT|nr:MAG: Unknown protein [uncultured Sulfurovum sp.]
MKQLIVFLLFGTFLFAKPFIPQDLNRTLLSLEQDEASKAIASLLQKVQAQPNNLVLVEELATLYIETAKKKANVSYMGYAKALLAPYLKKYSNNTTFILYQVDILQYTHAFDEALALLAPLTTKGAKEAKAYLMKATIYEAKEEYAPALRACKQLILRSSALLSATCISTMQSHLGKLEESYSLLEKVYAQNKQEQGSEQVWALTSLADMAYRLNQQEKALAYFKEALSINPSDHFVLRRMAEIYLEKKRYADVKTLLNAYSFVDALFLRETLAKEKLGENIMLEKERLSAYLKGLTLRDETPHQEDLPYFKALGLL